ncbi:hypothetical protein BDB01DRAFT_7604 [Pilobolus umbonatus]|nr:hypothetical protein BDB01DRAFT_7604 [Pilobolus umbonatus]
MVNNVFSIPVGDALPGEGPIYRSILSPGSVVKSPANGVDTLYDVFEYASDTYKDRKGFGYRELLDIIHETKEVTKIVNGEETTVSKTWAYSHLSEYKYLTYEEAGELRKYVGSGLAYIGVKRGDKIQLSASTSVEWILMAHGAFTQAATIVTAYDTLGPEGLQYSINESEATVLFMNNDQLSIFVKIMAHCPTVNAIVYRGEAQLDDIEKIHSNPHIKNILSYEELITLGKEHPKEVVKPTPDELCCIMYTSGSTGNPKGVMLSHGNVVSGTAGLVKALQQLQQPGESILAYLPLAHVLEFIVENVSIFLGVTLGYGSIRTLTENGVRNCKGDIQEFSPSIMTGVPQVWETIRKSVLTTVKKKGPRIETIFMRAVSFKNFLTKHGVGAGFLDRAIFKQVKQQLGGRLRYCISGGAPVSAETQTFLSMAACPVLTGYGMTESCGMCTLMLPDQYTTNEVGAPLPCVEVKMVDHPDLGYLSTNLPRPQGEVYIRGPSVTTGYYKHPELTKDAFTEDGWLKSGDIGEWTESGTISIIDRVKNLVKLSNGEYIAVEKLESVYKTSVLAENFCLYADPLFPKPVGLITPFEPQLKAYLAKQGIENPDYAVLCESKEARQAVLAALHAQGKSGGLKGAEIIHDVYICKDLWTPENELLTAAQKLKRKEITQLYRKQIDEMMAAQVI